MRNYILFLANTKQQVAECRYFLLKYLAICNLKPPAGTSVVVYTASPVAFENFTNFFPGFQMPDAAVLLENPTKTAALHHFFYKTRAMLFAATQLHIRCNL